jgi:hypothetical protein
LADFIEGQIADMQFALNQDSCVLLLKSPLQKEDAPVVGSKDTHGVKSEIESRYVLLEHAYGALLLIKDLGLTNRVLCSSRNDVVV